MATAGEEALTLFAADKLSKARELHLEGRPRPRYARTGFRGIAPSRELRLTHYRHCLALLEDELPDSPFVGALGAELARAESTIQWSGGTLADQSLV